jgi:general secretion pathway protein B
MSYILEALKKAQAERQLGNAPTIHAPHLHHAAPRLPAVKRSGVLALAAGAAVVAAAGWFAWSQRAPAPVAVLTPPAPVAVAPVAAPAAAPAATPTPAPAPVTVVAPAPVANPPPPAVARVEPVVRPRKAAVPAVPVAQVAAPAPAPVEENIRYAKDLPLEIQQQLPRVGFGGYMYSDNAADRLVLVDKTLRHEGEEIAPGLMLEKLLPKGAVLNYRGTRYRVGF